MRFHNIYFLLTFFIWFPVFIFITAWASSKRKNFLKQFGEFQQKSIFNISEKKLWLKRTLLFFTLLFLTIAGARPQMGESEINISGTGIDVAVLFDVSLSMLAEDENGEARFERGKQLLIDAISGLKGDRIAIVPFAGAAFLQIPLTSDYNTALTLVSSLKPGIISQQGTALQPAFDLAIKTLKSGDKGADKLIVLISDGEDPNIDFDKINEEMKNNHIKLAILPLGTSEGSPIKLGNSYIKNSQGKTVISKRNDKFFEEAISKLNAKKIKKGETLSNYIEKFKNKTTKGEKQIKIFKERFQIPLLLAILTLFLFLTIQTGQRRKK